MIPIIKDNTERISSVTYEDGTPDYRNYLLNLKKMDEDTLFDFEAEVTVGVQGKYITTNADENIVYEADIYTNSLHLLTSISEIELAIKFGLIELDASEDELSFINKRIIKQHNTISNTYVTYEDKNGKLHYTDGHTVWESPTVDNGEPDVEVTDPIKGNQAINAEIEAIRRKLRGE